MQEVAQVAGDWSAQIGLWMRDAARARRASELFDATPERGRHIAARRLAVRSGVLALEGDRDAALAGYRESLRRFRDMDDPYGVGVTQIHFATLLGPHVPEAAAAGEEARAYWTRLGSPPLLARLEEGLASWERPATSAAKTAQAGPEVTEAETAAAKQ
jgi:hypothetical protein